MSAKHGLIHSSEWIEPYDQLLNQERLATFASDKYLRDRARRHIRMMNAGAPLYLIVPKMNQNAFYALAGSTARRFEIVQASGGIFNQRKQLKNLLADEIELVAKRNRMECAAFRTFSGTPLKELWHLVRVGDWLRPWVSGVGASANFAAPIQVACLRCSISGSIHTEDFTGHIWNDYQVSAGIKHHGILSV
ncbi:hypothetical protein TUM3794_20970 [Shewanella colwelliana]|uniref:Uncharacterized protein n=1 Tax=Shewanella colwelliana TaxID=23 RepID=A0ABQ4P0Y1_SHECO|nr:hypothetical protein [Shewanella colwelliana]GIU41132.1 hypothetical protein TUM3794_20970 [Shewanella colwelliana]